MTALARHLEVRRGVPARDMDPAPSLMRACLAQGVVDGCDKIVMPVELDPITRRIKSAVGCDEMVMPAEEHQASRYVQMGLARLGLCSSVVQRHALSGRPDEAAAYAVVRTGGGVVAPLHRLLGQRSAYVESVCAWSQLAEHAGKSADGRR